MQISYSKTIVVVFCAALAAFFGQAAFAQGMLVPAGFPPQADSRFSVCAEDIIVGIENNCASVNITQVFRNDTGISLDAAYIFTLPENTISSGYYVWEDGVKSQGTHLLTVPAFSTKRVEVEYRMLLPVYDGLYRFKLPLLRKLSAPIEKFSVSVSILSSAPLQSLFSECGDFQLFKTWQNSLNDGRYVFANDFSASDFVPTGDCNILFKAVPSGRYGGQIQLFTHKVREEDGYFAVFMNPSLPAPEAGCNFILLLDCSESMSGEYIGFIRETALAMLDGLPQKSTFGIIAFNEKSIMFQNKPVENSEHNRKSASVFISNLSASGGTSLALAVDIVAALVDRRVENNIILISDGIVPLDVPDRQGWVQPLKSFLPENARLHCMGVGNCNEQALSSFADDFGGIVRFANTDENPKTVAQEFLRGALNMVDSITVDLGNVESYGFAPEKTKAVSSGSPAFIAGRYKAGCETVITVRGRSANGLWKAELPCAFPDEQPGNSYVADLWAHLAGEEPDGGFGVSAQDKNSALSLKCPVRIIDPAELPQPFFSGAELLKFSGDYRIPDDEETARIAHVAAVAQKALDEDDFAGAEGIIDAARKSGLQAFQMELMHAGICERRGRFTESETILKASVLSMPDKTAALEALAGFYERRMDFDSSVRVLLNLYKLQPGRAGIETLDRIISIYEKRRLYDAASAFYSEIAVLTSEPDDYARLADKLFSLKKDGQAVDAMRKAVELADDKAFYIRKLFSHFDSDGADMDGKARERLVAGMEILEKYLQEDPLLPLYADLFAIYSRLYIEELQQTLYAQKRRDVFSRSESSSGPEKLLCFFQMGQMLLYEKDAVGAAKMFRYCADNAEDLVSARHIAELIAYECGDITSAIGIYTRLFSIAKGERDKGMLLTGLADLYVNTGAAPLSSAFSAPMDSLNDESGFLKSLAGGSMLAGTVMQSYYNSLQEAFALYSRAAVNPDAGVRRVAFYGLADIRLKFKKYEQAAEAYKEILKYCRPEEIPDVYARLALAQDNFDPRAAEKTRKALLEINLRVEETRMPVFAVEPAFKKFSAEWYDFFARKAYCGTQGRDEFFLAVFSSGREKELFSKLSGGADSGDVMALKLLGDYFWHVADFAQAVSIYEKFAVSVPGRVDVLERIAKVKASLGRHFEAAQVYSSLCAFAPENPDWYRLAGENILQAGFADSAGDFFGNTILAASSDSDVLQELIEFCEQRGKYDTAIDIIKKARRQWKNDGLCAGEMGMLCAASGNYAAAVREYLKMFVFSSGTPQAGNAVSALVMISVERNYANLPLVLENTIESFQSVRGPAEQDDFLDNTFAFLEKLKRPDVEYSFYTRLTDVAGDEDAIYAIARRLENAGRSDLCEYAFLKAVKSYPKNSGSYRNLADFYSKNGKTGAVKEVLVRRTAGFPLVPESWLGLAQFCHENGSIYEAVQILEKAAEILPDDRGILLNLAKYCGMSGKFTAATGIYEKLIGLYPEETISYTELAGSYLNMLEPEKAEGALALLRTMHPDREKYCAPLVEFYIASGKDEQSSRIYDELQGEEKPALAARMGLAYLKTGNMKSAQKFLDAYFAVYSAAGRSPGFYFDGEIVRETLFAGRPDLAAGYALQSRAISLDNTVTAFSAYGAQYAARMNAREKKSYESACLKLLAAYVSGGGEMQKAYDIAVQLGLLDSVISFYAYSGEPAENGFAAAYACARLYQLDRKYPEAAFYYKKVIVYVPTSIAFHSELAGLLCQLGNFSAALEEYELIISLESARRQGNINNAETAVFLEKAFVTALHLGDIQRAVRFYSEYINARAEDDGRVLGEDYVNSQISMFCEENGYYEKAFEYLEKGLSGMETGDSSGLARAARLAKNSLNFDKAVRLYRRLADMVPVSETVAVYDEMIEAYELQDTLDNAAEKLEQELADTAQAESFKYNLLSRMLLSKGDFNGAVRVLEKACAKRPDDVELRTGIFRMYLSRKKWPEAIYVGRQIVRMPSFEKNPDDKIFAELAMACGITGDFDSAEHFASSALDIRPDCADYYAAMGDAAFAQKRYEKARIFFRAANGLRINNNPDYVVKYAETLVTEGGSFSAAEYVADAVGGIGAAYVMDGMGLSGYAVDFLLKEFSDLRERHSYEESQRAAIALFELCARRQDYVTPLSALLPVYEDIKAGRISVRQAAVAVRIAECYANADRIEDAIRILDKAPEVFGGDAPVYYALAQFYSSRMPEKSIDLYAKAITAGIEKGCVRPEYGLDCARVLFRLRRNKDAIAVLKNLSSEFPYDDSVMVSIGGLFVENGFAGTARQFYERAVRLSPDNTGNIFRILEYYQLTDEYSASQKYAGLALQSAPSIETRYKLRALRSRIMAGTPFAKEAQAQLQQEQRKRRISLENMRVLAQLYFESGEIERAEKTCREILVKHPYDRDAHLVMIDCEKKLNEPAESARLEKELDMIDPAWRAQSK
ncbi:MAG: tetratricopeptide repeat protein [Planctomycetes bacterium]|nr:tetratricopeptide repeat protein [Planctomycetota bacterium]